MGGLELVAGYLVAYAARKARRVGAWADGEVDDAIDAGLARLHRLVTGRLGGDPAVRQLEWEAGQGQPTERTSQRVRLAVEDAAERDPRFAAELHALVGELRRSNAPTGANTATVTASGHARAAGRDFTDNSRHTTIYRRSAALLATALVLGVLAGVGIHYVPRYLYQRQVRATCDRARDVLATPHSEIMRIPGFSAGPGPGGDVRVGSSGVTAGGLGVTDSVQADKQALVTMLTGELDQVRAEFATLATHSTPSGLRDQQAAVDQAFTRWVAARQQVITTARTRVRDGMTLGDVQRLGVLNTDLIGTTPSADVALNSAMSDLAGQGCTVAPSRADTG